MCHKINFEQNTDYSGGYDYWSTGNYHKTQTMRPLQKYKKEVT